MKKLLVILLFLPILCQAQKDKVMHFAAGAVVSSITFITVSEITENRNIAFWSSVGASVLVGLVKEFYDERKYGGFDTRDLVATSMGGLTVSVSFRFAFGDKIGFKLRRK